MLNDYKITTSELQVMGLNLEEQLNDITQADAFINTAFIKLIRAIKQLNDNIKFDEDIESELVKEPRLVDPFKRVQYQIVYNLCYLGDIDPINDEVKNMICFDLQLGKINSWQKAIYRR